MPLGLVGKKCGMTRVFTEDGVSIPVTVIEVIPNRVTQVKTVENDGYRALQITAGKKKTSKLSKAVAGHLAKAGVEAGDTIREFRLIDDEASEIEVGNELTVALFEEGQTIDVQGVSKGKGFQGGIKRHNFSHQRNSHGNSISHRALGSTGMCQTPGRVFKGKKMAGQMGNVNTTTQNQQIVKIDAERNLILVKGNVPGAPGGKVVVTKSVKSKAKGDK